MTNKVDPTITRAVVTLADLAPRQEVKGGAARVFGAASVPVQQAPARRPDSKSKPSKNR
jgi:hypothetical protein